LSSQLHQERSFSKLLKFLDLFPVTIGAVCGKGRFRRRLQTHRVGWKKSLSQEISEEVPGYQSSITGGYNLRYSSQADEGDAKRSAPEEGPREGSARVPKSPPSSERFKIRGQSRSSKRSSNY
jgi:hypothetical protein